MSCCPRRCCSLIVASLLMLVAACGPAPVGKKGKPAEKAGAAKTSAELKAVASAGLPRKRDDGVIEIPLGDVDLLGGDLAAKYPNQTVAVRGVVAKAEPDPGGKGTSLALASSPGKADARLFTLDEPELYARVAPGQSVTLEGALLSVDELFRKHTWKLAEAGPNPAPVLTGGELLEEFDENWAAALERYDGQWFYVTGTAASVAEGEFGRTNVVVAGPGPSSLLLALHGRPEAAGPKPGEPVAALCRLERLYTDRPVIYLEGDAISGPFPVVGVAYGKAVPTADERAAEVAAAMRALKEAPTLTVESLLAESRKGGPAYLKKYGGKVVNVTGVVESIEGYVIGGGTAVNLETPPSEEGRATCLVVDPTPWVTCPPGHAVTVRGRVDPFVTGHVALDAGVIIAAEPPAEPLPEFTAAELLRKALADPEKFHAEWERRPLLVTGPLARPEDAFEGSVELAGEDGHFVSGQLASEGQDQRMGLHKRPEGTPVKILGHVQNFNAEQKRLFLYATWIYPEADGAPPSPSND